MTSYLRQIRSDVIPYTKLMDPKSLHLGIGELSSLSIVEYFIKLGNYKYLLFKQLTQCQIVRHVARHDSLTLLKVSLEMMHY